MATRKALVLVSGLFQELNSSSDKLDFAGNSTTDLSEGSNQYFTTSRACLLYTSPSPRDVEESRMPSSA